jgi:hypothetical protein
MQSRFAHIVRWLAGCCATAAFVASTGCDSGEIGSVSGTLTRKDGTSLPRARVVARSSETGKSAYGTTDESGRYALGIASEGDGVPPGNYDVVILEDLGDPDNRRRPTVSAKYREPSTSGIRLSVESGESVELNARLDPP